MHKILKTVFQEGNRWFYLLAMVWLLATAVFLIAIPALLVSTGYWYEHESGVDVDFESDLGNLSQFLYGVAFEMWRGFALFLAISCGFDMYYFYLEKHKAGGYL